MKVPVLEQSIYRRSVRGKLAEDPMKRELIIDEGIPVTVDAARSNEPLVIAEIGAGIVGLEVIKNRRFTQKPTLVVSKPVAGRNIEFGAGLALFPDEFSSPIYGLVCLSDHR
ncbi:hypothetical protein [Halostagnicola kamekurae]|uniref:hypothetical protein n=1 Tax=Halostagnicola kamekurae TaxID=619731 RepID=UPI001FEC475A|nr:hypothetical protein [Halostagnicola kamekurae]